jgi:hypothetical protein
MGQLDKTFNDESYETRELAWELQQPHPDQGRVRLFLEQEADLRRALHLANIAEADLVKKPALRSLHLERHL